MPGSMSSSPVKGRPEEPDSDTQDEPDTSDDQAAHEEGTEPLVPPQNTAMKP